MRIISPFAMVVGVLCLLQIEAQAEIKAFRTAEGFGASATGGRGGDVYHVTNLNDTGDGSLRCGIDGSGGNARTIVFDVGGTINLASDLNITNNNLTIAGQTALGGGISIAGYSVNIFNRDNFVMRYVRCRLNNTTVGKDCISVYNSSNIVLDHVSMAWGMDGTLDITQSNSITVQNSIIAQTLTSNDHSYASLIRGNSTSPTSGDGITLARNLWTDNDRRSVGIGSNQTTEGRFLDLDMVNNVIYNWGSYATHNVQSMDDMFVNLVGNMYIAGPSTSSNASSIVVKTSEVDGDYDGDMKFYNTGNMIDSDKDKSHDPTTATFSSNFKKETFAWEGDLKDISTRYNFPTVTTTSAQVAYETVLASVGASLVRDSLDSTLISEVTSRTGGLVKNPGALPTIAGGTAATDTDQDGMPDWYESATGLNPYNAADRNIIITGLGGYTNLEGYLGYLAGDFTLAEVPEPSALSLLTVAFVTLYVFQRKNSKRRV